MEISEILPFFPYPEIRASQQQALEKIVETTNKGRKYTILELPTGTGKTGLSMAAARWSNSAYILTIQKMLQAQMMDEFSDLVEMKGAGNYRCGRFPVNCDEGSKMSQALLGEPCNCACPYKEAKDTFIHRGFGVTNFAYFLTVMAHQPGLLKKRKLLIIDEAHNTESALINHSNLEITRARCGELNIDFPRPPLGPKDLKKAKDWLGSTVFPAVDLRRTSLNQAITAARQGGKEASLQALLREETSLDQFEYKLRLFHESNSKLWFVGHTDKIEIKPLTGELFAEELLFSKADHVVFLSATILDPRTFVRNLGLSPKQCGYLGVPSEFPKENRRIVFSPAGSMSYKNYDATLPKLLKKLERIFNKHSEEKGIVHCGAYKTMGHIMEYFKGTPHAPRILSHSSNPRTKASAIAQHFESDAPTILLSPSMTEGLDLRDHLSRFQVVCKAPFGSLADPYIKTRLELDPDWYMLQACLTLCQATGRSVRSATDYAITYFIDSDITRLLDSGILPDWWLDSVEF